jgi:hypothetical protein
MDEAKAFAQRIADMDEEDQAHFRSLITKLLYCYTKNMAQAVVLYAHSDTPLVEALTINCDDMEGYAIVKSAFNYFAFLNTQDAPPREQFN